MRLSLFALTLGFLLAAVGESRAQFIIRGPNGSLGLPNGNGTRTFVYPERLVPGAGVAVPGTAQSTPFGPIYLGQDGQIHGNLVDPFGNIHMAEGTLDRSRSRSSSQYRRQGTNYQRQGTGYQRQGTNYQQRGVPNYQRRGTNYQRRSPTYWRGNTRRR